MYKLRTKMTASYIAVSLMIVILVIVLANVILEFTFQRYVMNAQQKNTEQLVQQLSDQYNSSTSEWDYGALDYIGMSALEKGLMIRVKTMQDDYIWDAWTHNNGVCTAMLQNARENMESRYPHFNGDYTEQRFDIIADGQQIGVVEVGYYGPFYYNDNDLYFINNLNRMLIAVAFFSLAITVLFGAYMSRRLTMPIGKVIHATEQISKGKFSERISIQSKTEEVKNLIASVNHLAESLETTEELRKRLTTDIAHELRTPLSTLQGYMEALIDGIWSPDKERFHSCHDEIIRLNRLVDDLANLSKLESQNMTVNKQAFNLYALMERTRSNFEAQFMKKGIRLTLENAYQGSICADKDKISQVLVNILSNALKYTNQGDAVTLSTRKEDNDTVEIIIQDSGIGMAKEDLPFIFERFYRTDKSRNRFTGGIGVGLSIARSLVLAHNGDLSVESELEKGSTFVIRLPLQ